MPLTNWIAALTNLLPWRFVTPSRPEGCYDLPRRIHFIWYGSAAPAEVQQNTLICQQLNPDWQVTLWSDRPQPAVRVPVKLFTAEQWRNQDIITAFQQQLGVLGDLLKYEIVYAYGGIYLDADVACLLPFNEPMFRRAFVCAELTQWKNLCASAFGCPPQSAFLDYVLNCVRENVTNWRPHSVPRVAGPPFLTTCCYQYADGNIQNIAQQIMLGHARQPDDPRPLYAKERLAAAWQAQAQNLIPYYQQLFNDTPPSISIPEPT